MSKRALQRNGPLALAAVQRGNHQQGDVREEIIKLTMPGLHSSHCADPNTNAVNAFKRVKPELEVVVLDGAPHIRAARRPEFIKAYGVSCHTVNAPRMGDTPVGCPLMLLAAVQ
jgi:hypothetical protein